MKYLTLFTIGPVQSFIAKARKLQDLYAGSFLLSYLSKQTMFEAQKHHCDILFPDPQLESAPNRFLMTVEVETSADLRALCEGLAEFVRREWVRIARTVLAKLRLEYSATVSAQIDSLIQVYYASEKYCGGERFGEYYNKVVKKLNVAKMIRGFSQLNEPYGRKCNLNHEHNALFFREWHSYLTADAQKVTEYNIYNLDKYIQPDETLGAIALVKRCLNYAIPIPEFDDRFPSVVNIFRMRGGNLDDNDEENQGYYAVVMFDGDDMGRWYSTPEKKGVASERAEAFQQHLSRSISQFAADNSRKIVKWDEKKNGVVIYAGGEDFLGALNINHVFPALYELREAFGKIDLSEYTTAAALTFSAGVVVAHVKTPLSAVLDMARDAEHKAKHARKDKDMFCLTIARHSGEVTEFVMPFYHGEKSNLNTLETLVTTIVNDGLSNNFIYQLSMELERIAETENACQAADNKAIFLAEAGRLLAHSEFEDEKKRDRIVTKVTRILAELAEDSVDPEKGFDLKNLLMYLRAIAFIARERRAV